MAKKIAIDIDIQGTKDVLELQKAIRGTKKELKETEDVKAYDKLATDLVKLQAQLKEARKRQRQAVDAFAATDKGIGAYSRLSAQLRVARNNLKDLAADGKTTGEEVEKLTNEVSQLDTQLKDIDRSVGQTNREIGDYENAIRKATGLTEKQTGAFTRMTGKLNVLKRSYKDIVVSQGAASKGAKTLRKDILKLEKQLKQASIQSDKTGKKIGSLRSQFRGLGPAAAGISNAFQIFSALPFALDGITESIDLVKQGFNGLKNALDEYEFRNSEVFQTQKEVNKQLDIAGGLYFKEREQVNALFQPLNDDNISREDKKKLIDKINESYGEYLPNLLTDKASNEDLAKAQQAVNEGLARKFALQAQEKQISEVTQKIAEREIEFQKDLAQRLERQQDEGVKRRARARGESQADQNKRVETQARFAADRDVKILTDRLKRIKGATDKTVEALIGAGVAFDEATKENAENSKKTEAEIEAEKAAARRKALEAQKASQSRSLRSSQNAAKRKEEEAKRAALQLAKNREKFLQQEIKDEQKRANILLSLSAQLTLATLNNLEEGEQKQIALEENASQKRIANLKAQNAAFEQNAQERINKAVELFGAGSAKVLELEKQLGGEQIKVQKQIFGLIEQEEFASQKRIEKIKKDFAAKDKEDTKASLKDKLSIIKAAAQKVIDAKEKEQKELLKLEKERVEETVQIALNSIKQALGFVNDFATALNDKELERLQGLADERAANIEGLQEQLQSASGLEKAFLEQRVSEETKAAKEIAAQQERARKENAIAQKAIAITQAIINGALAVTAILAQTTDPTPVQAFRFAAIAAAIATTAAQVAIIAAQPLATGGIVSGAQNIKTQPNGDNVLTTLTRGEVVLNKSQQEKLGGAKTFACIGVPGFAGGGVVSPPIGAPAVGNLAKSSTSTVEILSKMSEMITATNNRIDRIEVLYTTNTGDSIKNDSQDRKEIKTRATI